MDVQEELRQQLLAVRDKDKRIKDLFAQVGELEARLAAKSDGDLTMNEVIERVKAELAVEFEPQVASLKEELSAKDQHYLREEDRLHKVFNDEHQDLLDKIQSQALDLDDLRKRLEDKHHELRDALRQIDEKRDLYNGLVERKGEMEKAKNQAIEELERLNAQLNTHLHDKAAELASLNKQLLDTVRENDKTKIELEEVIAYFYPARKS